MVQNFTVSCRKLRNKGHLQPSLISDSYVASKESLHSLLHGALIEAGFASGLKVIVVLPQQAQHCPTNWENIRKWVEKFEKCGIAPVQGFKMLWKPINRPNKGKGQGDII